MFLLLVEKSRIEEVQISKSLILSKFGVLIHSFRLKTEKWQIDENDGTSVQAGTLKAPVKHFNEAMEPTTNSGDYAYPGAIFVDNAFCQNPAAGTFKWNKNY